jgi:hypothetical protein
MPCLSKEPLGDNTHEALKKLTFSPEQGKHRLHNPSHMFHFIIITLYSRLCIYV